MLLLKELCLRENSQLFDCLAFRQFWYILGAFQN